MNNTKLSIYISFSILLFANLTFGESSIKIGNGGAQTVTVALSSNASTAEKWAATELTTAVNKMTGLSVNVQYTSDYNTLSSSSFCFLLGILNQSPLLQPFINNGDIVIPVGRPKYDGFVFKYIYKNNRNMLIISGNSPCAISNGVFYLLEREWHCGFFDDSFESPRYPQSDVLVVPMDFQIIEPAFENREVINVCNYAYAFGGWSRVKKQKFLDHIARQRYNRYTPTWQANSSPFPMELYNQGKLPYGSYNADFNIETVVLNYWNFQRGKKATIGIPSCALSGLPATAYMNTAYPGYLGFLPEQSYMYFNPNDSLIRGIDVNATQNIRTKTGALANGNWYELTPPSEQAALWGTPTERRENLLNYARAGINLLNNIDPSGKLTHNGWGLIHSIYTVEDFHSFYNEIANAGKQVITYDLMACDGVGRYATNNYYYGQPWIIGTVPQLRFVDELYYNMPQALDVAKTQLQDCATNSNNNLIGFSYQAEGFGGMAMTMDFVHLLAWNPSELTIDTWVSDYATRRYGIENAHLMLPALNDLKDSIFSNNAALHLDLYHPSAPHKDIRMPSQLSDPGGAYAAREAMVPKLRDALEHALAEWSKLEKESFYSLDLIEIAKMYAYCSEEICQVEAWRSVQNLDLDGLEDANVAMTTILNDLSTLMACHSRYWNVSHPYGYNGGDEYYFQDTYEQLTYLYSARVKCMFKKYKSLVEAGQSSWDETEAVNWRTQMYADTRTAYNNNSTWQNIQSSEQYPMTVIEAVRKLLVNVSTINGRKILGPYVNSVNGQSYYLIDKGERSLAIQDAKALGGYLAVIKNANENQWLWDTFHELIGASWWSGAWIGLSDENKEGTFVWCNGEPLVYTNWWPWTPWGYDDHDYVVMEVSYQNQWQGYNGEYGKWSDIQIEGGASGTILPSAIIEIPKTCAQSAGAGFIDTVPADLNKDCYIDSLDLLVLIESWLKCNDAANTLCQ
jgi:hypothetical protein